MYLVGELTITQINKKHRSYDIMYNKESIFYVETNINQRTMKKEHERIYNILNSPYVKKILSEKIKRVITKIEIFLYDDGLQHFKNSISMNVYLYI